VTTAASRWCTDSIASSALNGRNSGKPIHLRPPFVVRGARISCGTVAAPAHQPAVIWSGSVSLNKLKLLLSRPLLPSSVQCTPLFRTCHGTQFGESYRLTGTHHSTLNVIAQSNNNWRCFRLQCTSCSWTIHGSYSHLPYPLPPPTSQPQTHFPPSNHPFILLYVLPWSSTGWLAARLFYY